MGIGGYKLSSVVVKQVCSLPEGKLNTSKQYYARNRLGYNQLLVYVWWLDDAGNKQSPLLGHLGAI